MTDISIETTILEQVFDDESSVYPLQIIPTGLYGYGVGREDSIIELAGIHFVDTVSLLSILEDVPIEIEAAFSKEGKPCKHGEEPAYYFRSMEIGLWCQDLLEISGVDSLEHCEVPYLYYNKDFERCAEMGLGCLSKQTLGWCLGSANTHMTDYFKAKDQVERALKAYVNILQGIFLANTDQLVCEANALIDVADEDAPSYLMVLEKANAGEDFTRREAALVYSDICTMAEKFQKMIGDSKIRDVPSEETAIALNEELLRLRRSLI